MRNPKENARFREQIERETITAKMPKHLEWVNDFSCPSVRVRVYDEAGFQNFQDPAIGTLHIPIHSMEGTEALVAVPLHGGRVKTMFGPRLPMSPSQDTLVAGRAPTNNKHRAAVLAEPRDSVSVR